MITDLGAKLVLTYILGHFGDYVLQSDWMANEKTKKSLAAAAHAIVYTLPFLLVTRNPIALGIICASHFVIDRFRLARYICWIKNFIGPPATYKPAETVESAHAESGAPVGVVPKPAFPPGRIIKEWHSEPMVVDRQWWRPWPECSATGYHKDVPPWLSVWLMIKADNTIHQLINFFVILYLG